ncbi:radical SAM protein [Roseimaritima sediminicola]|uniref:radical SAM protein n=1 Tax=Roseimaritima sediminicola TaxID=2662066 RepID=UPI0012982F20|nr:radical SAM protein [Roseimaritima sediminicola]
MDAHTPKPLPVVNPGGAAGVPEASPAGNANGAGKAGGASPAAKHRDYTYLGTTDSLCPQCMQVVRAKIIVRSGRVYFQKRCPRHGPREDFVCSDVRWYDRLETALPAKLPERVSVAANKGCPYDCGLCEEHEQHTCIGLVEVTASCNLKCPMCFASSGPGGEHLSVEQAKAAIDALVAAEGHAEVCQISGGEPTIHPHLLEIVDYALGQPIDYVMINTNGLRFASDAALVEALAKRRERLEIYFQFDGRDASGERALRGETLAPRKQRALDRLAEADLNVTLVATLHGPDDHRVYERLIGEAMRRPNVVGLSLQPATYSGRHVLPSVLEQRVTFPDVIRGIAAASGGMLAENDFTPLPCAHPNCHQIMLAIRSGGGLLPLARVMDVSRDRDLLANGISFTRERSKQLIAQYLGRASGCGSGCGCGEAESGADAAAVSDAQRRVAEDFFGRVIAGQAGARDVFRITITNFLDAYNFDIRRLMKCCTHHVLPSGHLIPFCAYNTLYRPGHVPLPPAT